MNHVPTAHVREALTSGSVLLALCLAAALAVVVPAQLAARRTGVPAARRIRATAPSDCASLAAGLTD
jgi:hypothetical protein